jgi:hypothetical protein
MNWTPITPETLPPCNVWVLLWHKDDTWEQWMINESGRWSAFGYAGLIPLLPDGYTHWTIPTPPGTPPAVAAEVAKVLGVDLAELEDVGINLVNFRKADAIDYYEEYDAKGDPDMKLLKDHIDAIRAARAAMGMDLLAEGRGK